MRKLVLVVMLSSALGGLAFAAFAPEAGAANKAPVKVTGKVNVHGKDDVSGESKAAVSVKLDDYYFSPTFIKVAPGQKVTLKLENESGKSHTFTSDELGVDKELAPGKSATVKVAAPSGVTSVRYYCQFHDALGMQGAFYAAATDGR